MESSLLNLLMFLSKKAFHIFLIQVIAMQLLLAAPSKGQGLNEVKIDLHLTNATLRGVLDQIESETKFRFGYNKKTLDTDVRISFQNKQMTLEEVLLNLSEKADVRFRRVNDHILILEKTPEDQITEAIEEVVPVTVSGKLTDKKSGEPLIGATIKVKGMSIGTVTDIEGRYRLEVPTENEVLIFSYVGYLNQELKLNGQTSLNVSLEQDVTSLNEIVVMGYGTQMGKEISGSVSTITSDEINLIQGSTFGQSLVGVTPGVRVTQTTGQPGAAPTISIRGTGSITAGNDPLYVIDGFPVSDEALNTLNNSDIESITILKDASSASIYGSRGSNGVVLITTKRGNSGKPRVSFNSYVGLQKVTKKMDVLSPEEYVEFREDAANYAWELQGGDASDANADRPTAYQIAPYLYDQDSWVRTDWQDEIYRTAPMFNNEIAVTGGTDRLKYRLSGNIFDNDGVINKTNYTRYSVRSNVHLNVTERIRAIVNLNYTLSREDLVSSTGTWNNGVVGTALGLPGFFAPQNEDGSYSDFSGFGYGVSEVNNPMTYINEQSDEREKSRILANMALEYEPIDDLVIKGAFSMDHISSDENFFAKSYEMFYENDKTDANGTYTGLTSKNWLFEGTANYNKSFGNHHFTALAGYTIQKFTQQDVSISAEDFPNNLVTTLNAGVVTSASTSIQEWSLLSYLGRINYDYNGRYLATFTVRRDGSSRFGKDNKWGVFPSASLGWVISEESFLSNSNFIDLLKLRLSYGLSGNNAIPNYGSIGLLGSTDYVYGSDFTTGLVQTSNSNANLSWETSQQWDLGLEWAILNSRIKITADVYQKTTKDLLLEVNIPSIYGFGSALQNIGKVRNRGVELALSTVNLKGKFNWTTDFNISLNRNKVLALGPSGDPIISSTYGGSPTHITQVGSPIGQFYGYVWEGVYNTQEEIEAHAHLDTDVPGMPIVKDVNGDGEISTEDRTVIGSNQPDFMYGFNNMFQYKNFDLSVFVQGVAGAQIMNIGMRQTMVGTARTNNLGMMRDRWRSAEDPGNGKIPAASHDIIGVRRDVSTMYVEDGSYMRVRNITFGYTFTGQWVNELGVSNARIYVSTNNPFIKSHNTGYNPEVNTYNDSLTPGTETHNYPTTKSLIFGVSLNF